MRLIKSFLLVSILCFFASNVFAVAGNRYFVVGGNWSSTASWSLTDGGLGGAAVPTITDTVIFTGNGNFDCTADAGTCTGYSITFQSGYTHKLTCTVNVVPGTGGLSLSANMTFTASTTKGFSGTSTVSSTWTSNGVTVTVLLTPAGLATTTFGDIWTATGGVFAGGPGITLNSNTLNIAGGTLTALGTVAGTTTIVFGTTGSMTWAGTSTVSNNVTFNTSGTITLASGVTLAYGGTGNTLTYTAGTMVTTNNGFTLAGNCTLNTAGMSFNNLGLFTGTATLNSALSVTGTLSDFQNSITWAGSFGWTCGTISNNQYANLTWTLHSGNTYIVTTAFNITGCQGLSMVFKASTVSGTKALLNYTGTVSGLNILYTNFTDIDASGGNTIWDYVGVLTRTVNINNRVAGSYVPVTVASGSSY